MAEPRIACGAPCIGQGVSVIVKPYSLHNHYEDRMDAALFEESRENERQINKTLADWNDKFFALETNKERDGR